MTKDDIEIIYLVYRFFKGDTGKTYLWLNTPNPILGAIIPMRMMKSGRSKRLLQMIKDLLKGNIE